MVQRSPTTVVKSETLMELGFDIYSENARAARHRRRQGRHDRGRDALCPAAQQQQALYDRIRARDADVLQRACAPPASLLDFGEDETGLMMKA